MARKILKIKTGTGGRVINFFAGFFLGIILMIAALFGFGYWVYSGVDLYKIEDWLNIEINLGDANNIKSLKVGQLIAICDELISRKDTLSLSDIEDNFNITLPDFYYGIDLAEIKNVPILTIPQHIDLIVKNMTFGAFATITDTELPDVPILNANLDVPIDIALKNIFDTLDIDTVSLEDLTNFGIDFSHVDILKDLPQDTLISELGDAILDNMLLSQYTDTTSGIFNLLDLDTTLTELPDAIKNLLKADSITLAQLKIIDPDLQIPSGWEDYTLQQALDYLPIGGPA